MDVFVLHLESRSSFTAPYADAVSAFNRMEKGVSYFSRYPVKCGKWLAGVRSQTSLM